MSKDDELTVPNHALIRKADPFDFQVAHRRLAWCFRLSVMVNVALAAAVCALVAMIVAMIPLQEVKVALIKADTQENLVYRVEPISPQTDGFKLLLETRAMGFVEDTMTIDPLTSETRGAEARKLMTEEYSKKYKRAFIDNGWLQKAMDDGLNRSIIVDAVHHVDNPINDGQHILSVDYTQIDQRAGTELSRKKYRAFIKLFTDAQKVQPSEVYRNPLGVFVRDMTIKEIKG